MLAKKCHSPGRSRTLLLAQRAFAEVLLPPPGYSISQRPSPLRNSPFMSFVRPSIHRTRPFISFTSFFKNEMSMEVRLSSHCEGGLVSLLTASYKDFRAERKSFSAARMRAHDLPRSLEPDHGYSLSLHRSLKGPGSWSFLQHCRKHLLGLALGDLSGRMTLRLPTGHR